MPALRSPNETSMSAVDQLREPASLAVPLRVDEGGVIRVGDTRVTLDVVLAAYREGASPEEILLRFPTLRLQHIYLAISYYLAHRDEIEDYLLQGEEAAREWRDRSASDSAELKRRLLERRVQAGE